MLYPYFDWELSWSRLTVVERIPLCADHITWIGGMTLFPFTITHRALFLSASSLKFLVCREVGQEEEKVEDNSPSGIWLFDHPKLWVREFFHPFSHFQISLSSSMIFITNPNKSCFSMLLWSLEPYQDNSHYFLQLLLPKVISNALSMTYTSKFHKNLGLGFKG